MGRVTPQQRDEMDRKIAVCLGAGLSIEKTAEHIGIVNGTVYNHLDGPNRPFIDTLRSEVEAAIAVKGARAAERVAESAEKRIARLFDRSFALTERAIQKAEDDNDLTLPQLVEIHKSFTQWATKFVTSEAPKRLSLEGQVDHVHTHQVSGELMNRLDALQAERVRPAIAGQVIDV